MEQGKRGMKSQYYKELKQFLRDIFCPNNRFYKNAKFTYKELKSIFFNY